MLPLLTGIALVHKSGQLRAGWVIRLVRGRLAALHRQRRAATHRG